MLSQSDINNCNRLSKTIAVFLCLCFTVGCSLTRVGDSSPYTISFLDEYILDDKKQIDGYKIGGLSGIDYDGNSFVLISDHSKNPIIYKTSILIDSDSIHSIKFNNTIKLNCDSLRSLDTESIRFHPYKNQFIVSGEGNINRQQDPVILHVNNSGRCIKSYKVPTFFEANAINGPRHNAVFEGLSLDYEKTGFWVINELPLKRDGKSPKLYNTNSPLRLTHYNMNNLEPDYQLAYDLDRLVKVPFLPFGLNGATEILQIDEDYLLVLERGFSAGHKSKGNRIKIFLVNISNQENLLDKSSFKTYKSQNLEKELVFDSKLIRKQLQYKFVDNIEGMSFGPDLDNGNKSLILVSDNNFNAFGNQINQFLLLKLSKK
jgi:hypothetical protein